MANALLGFVAISPVLISICRNGEPIVFNGFSDDKDVEAGIHVERHVARLGGGIPNPKVRPVVELPWDIEFNLTLFKNEEFKETWLKNAFMKGGIALGLGTYRGVYGKFIIEKWE